MAGPRIPSFIRNVQRQPREFSYRPRYYDADREDLERRKARIEREVAEERGEAPDPQSKPRGISFRDAHRRDALARAKKDANRRLLTIVALLVILVILLRVLGRALPYLEQYL